MGALTQTETKEESDDETYVDGYEHITETMLFQAFSGIFGNTKSMEQIASLFNRFKKALDLLVESSEICDQDAGESEAES